jgi:peptide/nickel transport system substrate-binding protein
MDGEAIATSQYAIQGLVGFDSDLPVEKYDPQGAKDLLATAGYPRGFGLSINCSNNRYPNDEKICQALGQMMTRVGLQAKVETMPVAMLTPLLRGTPTEPSKVALGLNGIGAISNLPPVPGFVVHSINAAVGRGGSNYGRFSDPALDRSIDEAIATPDLKLRDQRLRDAMAAARREVPVIPLYFQKVITASRADLVFHTNPFEETLAWHIHQRQ